MVALDAANRQFPAVEISIFIACLDSLLSSSCIQIIGVPLLSETFIGGDIVHDRGVHVDSEAEKHQEKGAAVEHTDCINDVNTWAKIWVIISILLLFILICIVSE